MYRSTLPLFLASFGTLVKVFSPGAKKHDELVTRLTELAYYYANNLEYQLEVTVFPADGGLPGDATQDITSVILDMPDEPFSWSYQTDTFTLDGTTSVNVDITSCDSYCPSESTMDITRPDGTVDSTGYWSNGYTGTVATYTDAGTYTIEKWASWGDGGFGVSVGSVLGSFTGILLVMPSI
jgi:hypothetical protein